MRRGEFRVWQPERWSFDRGTAASEPVSVETVKEHLRVDHDDEDTLIGVYVSAARAAVEAMTNRLLAERSVVLRLSRFPPGERQEVALPGGRVQSITSVAYDDEDDVPRTFTAFETDLVSEPGRLRLADNAEWPSARDWALPVAITYLAGYPKAGADYGANVPPDIKAAILLMAAQLYDERKPVAAVSMVEIPLTLQHLLAPHVVRAVF